MLISINREQRNEYIHIYNVYPTRVRLKTNLDYRYHTMAVEARSPFEHSHRSVGFQGHPKEMRNQIGCLLG